MIVYRYRIAPPEDAADRELFFAQLLCAHRYRNVLVAIERARRSAVRVLYAKLAPHLGELEVAAERATRHVEERVLAIRKERARTRKRSDGAAMREALKQARAEKKAAAGALRETRRRITEDPRFRAWSDLLGERALELVRNARAHSGLARRGPHFGAFGTYLLVEEAAKKSFSDLPLYGPDGAPKDPHFVPWTGEGCLGVQIAAGGARVADVVGGVARHLQVDLPDGRAFEPAGQRTVTRGVRDALARQARVRFYVGTDEGGTPKYLTCRTHAHRPLPEGGIVKCAALERVKVGYGARWTLLVTVDAPERARSVPTRGGAVAVDLGWRVLGDELRVAGWRDAEGREGHLCLDAETLRRLREPEQLRSRRDFAREAMQLRIGTWLQRFDALPDWLRQEASRFRLWHAPWKLLRLLATWRERRFDGDEVAFSSLEAWAGNERWMHTQEADWRARALARRGDLYRNFAAQLAAQYETIVLEDFDLRRLARKRAVEDDADNETARRHRQLACVHGLRLAIVGAASGRGHTIVKVPAADTTRACPHCGVVEDRSAAESIALACDACGAAWDQDVSGAPVVLLARARERSGDAGSAGGARAGSKSAGSGQKGESRRDRVARKRREKEARMVAAREAGLIDAEWLGS